MGPNEVRVGVLVCRLRISRIDTPKDHTREASNGQPVAARGRRNSASGGWLGATLSVAELRTCTDVLWGGVRCLGGCGVSISSPEWR